MLLTSNVEGVTALNLLKYQLFALPTILNANSVVYFLFPVSVLISESLNSFASDGSHPKKLILTPQFLLAYRRTYLMSSHSADVGDSQS